MEEQGTHGDRPFNMSLETSPHTDCSDNHLCFPYNVAKVESDPTMVVCGICEDLITFGNAE